MYVPRTEAGRALATISSKVAKFSTNLSVSNETLPNGTATLPSRSVR